MPIYWSMLFMTLIIGMVSKTAPQRRIERENKTYYTIHYGFAVAAFLYIIFFVGLRDRVLDTGAYVRSFNEAAANWSDLIQEVASESEGKGFYLLQGLFKIYISKSHYMWFLFLATISCLGLLKVLYKYSEDFPLAIYLFVADATFTWLLNGTRQFLVVCILFSFAEWLIEGKKIRYLLLVLVMTTIHSSAIFMVLVCLFVSAQKILDEKMMIFAIITVWGTKYSEKVFEMLDFVLEKDYVETLVEGVGSNIIRLLVSAVPILIVMAAYKYVKENSTPSIRLAINMSFVGTCFYFASSFTNGILVGRMPVYFTLYNLYLLPWLIKNCFNKESEKIAKILCMLLYGVYFYYQMEIAWGGLQYISEILNLSFK